MNQAWVFLASIASGTLLLWYGTYLYRHWQAWDGFFLRTVGSLLTAWGCIELLRIASETIMPETQRAMLNPVGIGIGVAVPLYWHFEEQKRRLRFPPSPRYVIRSILSLIAISLHIGNKSLTNTTFYRRLLREIAPALLILGIAFWVDFIIAFFVGGYLLPALVMLVILAVACGKWLYKWWHHNDRRDRLERT